MFDAFPPTEDAFDEFDAFPPTEEELVDAFDDEFDAFPTGEDVEDVLEEGSAPRRKNRSRCVAEALARFSIAKIPS